MTSERGKEFGGGGGRRVCSAWMWLGAVEPTGGGVHRHLCTAEVWERFGLEL